MSIELTAINVLEDQVNFLKELENDLRTIRQDTEKELRNIILRRELQSRNNVTPPEAATVSDPAQALEGSS